MDKQQQLLSDLIDSSTVNDNHQSVIVVEDAIEMIEKALEGCAIVPIEPTHLMLCALCNGWDSMAGNTMADNYKAMIEASNEE